MTDDKAKNPNAVALGALGGKKRAQVLSATERTRIATTAGQKRWNKVSKEERSRIAKRAVEARWKKKG